MQRVLSFPPPTRGFGDPSEFVSKRMCFSFMFSLGFLAFLGGFLLGRFVFDQELELSRSKLKKAHLHHQQIFGTFKNYSQYNMSNILDDISDSDLVGHQRLLRDGGSVRDSTSNVIRQAEILHKHISSNGFDLVSPLVESQIHLSYPSSKHPNLVTIQDDAGNVIRQFNDTRQTYNEDVAESSTVSSASAVVGDVVYVNFGRNEDYHYLDSVGVSVSGQIVLIRAGGLPSMDMVTNALDHDALGILIYMDPQQQQQLQRKEAKRPILGPTDLAKVQILQGNQIDKWSGKVPLLEISPENAEEIFNYMSASEPSAESWRGQLKCSYAIGPGFSDPKLKLRMDVNTVNVVRTYFDVLGAMRGSQEPDRFVMLAGESTGKEEEIEANSVLMEVARVLGNLKKKGWTPHRSIVIAFWGPEGPNRNLATHPETIWSQLITKTVAYLKVDSVDDEPGTEEGDRFRATATPILEKLFFKSADASSMDKPYLNFMMPPSPDNMFIEYGIPFMETNDLGPWTNGSLRKMTTFWSAVTWNMAESHGLPFSLSSYDKFLSHSLEVIEKRFKTIAQKHTLFLDTLLKSVRDLIQTIRSFEVKWSHADKSKSIEMRIMNDQLLDFVHSINCNREESSTAYPSSSSHFIFSKSLTGSDDTAGFGLLQDLLREISSSRTPENLHRRIITHLANLVECINFARYTLTESLDTFVTWKT